MCDASAVLAASRVPGTCVFFLGCFESRVTVLSQQRRALNLVDALLSSGAVRGNARIAVIGGGAAGLTAAAALARAAPELRIDLFERSAGLMHLQRTSDRNLHPRIYDWPSPGWDVTDAGLPFLNWQAGPARVVAEQIVSGFDAVQRNAADRLHVHCRAFVQSIELQGQTACKVIVELQPTLSGWYAAAILAIGFGFERDGPNGQESSYWAPTPLAGPFPPGPTTILVSGNGDGGLVDFATAAFSYLDHGGIISLVTGAADVASLTKSLMEIEERAWVEGQGCDIWEEYCKLSVPASLLELVHRHLKPDLRLWFVTKESHLFRRSTAVLNRFTAFLALRAGGADMFERRTGVERIAKNEQGAGFLVGDALVRAQRTVFRHGAASEANLVPFAALERMLLAARPKPAAHYRAALPDLTDGARSRFVGVSQGHVSTIPEVDAASTAEAPAVADRAEDARRWLIDRGILVAPSSLQLYILSGVVEAVSALLHAGISPDTLLDGVTPLELALRQVDARPGRLAPDVAALAVVGAIAAAAPRDIGEKAHHALSNAEAPRLLALLRGGGDLGATDAAGQSLVAHAMRQDDAAQARSGWTELLAREGPSMTRVLASWMLLWAASTDRAKLLTHLLDRGVPVDSVLHDGDPPEAIRDVELHFWNPGGTSLHRLLARAERPLAMFYAEDALYDSAILHLLLERGASPAARDAWGRTPLHIAATEGLERAAHILCRASGADLSARDQNGETPLECALRWPRSSGIAQMLIAQALPLDAAERAKLMHRAAYNRDIEVLRQLLDAGCDANAGTEDQPSPLMALVRHPDFVGPVDRGSVLPCLTLLLERGADPAKRDASGVNALHCLAQGKDAAAVERLLAAGLPPDSADLNGHTPLMLVNTVEIAQCLLSAGATPQRGDRHGYDALDHAVIRGREDLAAILGAPGRAPRPQSRLVRAVLDGDRGLVAELLAAGVDPATVDGSGSPVLNLAAARRDADIVGLLLDRGARADSWDAHGHQALHACLWAFGPADGALAGCLSLLLDAGAPPGPTGLPGRVGEAAIFKGFAWWDLPDVAARLIAACRDSVNAEGATALMVAAQRGTPAQVTALLRNGLDARAADRAGRTALHYAASLYVAGLEQRMIDNGRALLKAGAVLDAADAAGETPLFAAVESGNAAVVHFLLDGGADANHRNAHGESLQRVALRHREVDLANHFLSLERAAGVLR